MGENNWVYVPFTLEPLLEVASALGSAGFLLVQPCFSAGFPPGRDLNPLRGLQSQARLQKGKEGGILTVTSDLSGLSFSCTLCPKLLKLLHFFFSKQNFLGPEPRCHYKLLIRAPVLTPCPGAPVTRGPT